ncbi:helix-turn-helix transcriptional regulator [Candidatus Undinarchaeota archaeon]
MRFEKVLILLWLVMIAGAAQAAYHFEDYGISIELDVSNSVQETIDMILVNDGEVPISEMEYSLAFRPENLFVDCNGVSAEYEFIENDGKYLLNIVLPEILEEGESVQVTVSFTANGIIEKVGDRELFSMRYTPVVRTDNFDLRIVLPEGAGLTSEEETDVGLSSVSPVPTKIYPSGKGIALEWNKQVLEPDEGLSVMILYKNYVTSTINSIFLPMLFGLIVGAGAILAYFKKAAPAEKKRLIVIGLSDDEKKIVELVSGEWGEITQKDLIKQTNYSKSKMSKIIRRLEEKGVITKKPYQRTNKIFLTEKV